MLDELSVLKLVTARLEAADLAYMVWAERLSLGDLLREVRQ